MMNPVVLNLLLYCVSQKLLSMGCFTLFHQAEAEHQVHNKTQSFCPETVRLVRLEKNSEFSVPEKEACETQSHHGNKLFELNQHTGRFSLRTWDFFLPLPSNIVRYNNPIMPKLRDNFNILRSFLFVETILFFIRFSHE